MVHADDHHVLFGQVLTGIPSRRARVETASMQPHHHGTMTSLVGGPDIEHAGILLGHLAFGEFMSSCLLHRLWSEVVARANRIPWFDGLRRQETFDTRIRNTKEGHRTFLYRTTDWAAICIDNQRVVFTLA